MNTEQKLGIRVFYYYLSKRILIGSLFLVGSFILLGVENTLISWLKIIVKLPTAMLIMHYLLSILFIVSVIIIIAGGFLSWLDYMSCGFTLDEASFNIRRGIFNKKEFSIPYRQIQNIDIEQTFHYRMMGVSKLIILTDGEDAKGGGEGIFQVIDSTVAENVRKAILQKTNVQRVAEVPSQ